MDNFACTIITANYAHYALALFDSIAKYNTTTRFAVFVSHGELSEYALKKFQEKEVNVFTADDFETNTLAKHLKEKYSTAYHDAYRWGMKSVFINELLNHIATKAIYLDSDVFFYDDIQFLFNRLDACNLLLSPHWRSSDPKVDNQNFRHNFLDGIYNGGFVGATKGASEALNYWGNLCLFNCEVNRNDGYYVDQRYLDILPTRFDGVDHIRHKGCNVANWNIVDCKRVLQEDGSVLINNKYPVVFIHFTNSLFKGVYVWKTDPLLQAYVKTYRDAVYKYYDKDIIEEFLDKGIAIKSRSEKRKKNNKNIIKRVLKKVYSFINS